MRIAVIGSGASGMATAYLLDKQGHHVTVFERQPILGGHIRTLNKNVKPNQSACDEVLEAGVLEFPTVFYNFIALMQDLDVELEPVNIGSAMFLNDGDHFLSAVTIEKNFAGLHGLIEKLRLDAIYARSVGLWLRTQFANLPDLANRPLSEYLNGFEIRDTWLKLVVMYSYSIPFELIDDFPAELAIPTLRDYLAVNWVRVKGGVYTYIEKILERFKGEIVLNVEIDRIVRSPDGVKIMRSTGEIQEFDKVVFATPPDQVMALLADPTEAETKRFSAWTANYATTIVHRDTSIYARHGITQPSEFDFFQKPDGRWGYNGCLNQLCGITTPEHNFLSFQLEELIAPDRIIHTQEHHTPMYTTESFRYRDEVVATNGENNTYHAGAYLGDGLHEGAIASAFRVAQLVGSALVLVH
jgi:predicted NAD/FAD-binding protein